MKYSIIIPTYNHLEDCLKPCLDSVIQNSSPSVEIIVIANGCTDATETYVRNLNCANIRLICFTEPLGYTKAINEGIKASTGDYLVLLNNDCVILNSNWLDILYSPFVDANVGITGPMLQTHPTTKINFLLFFCVMIRRSLIDRLGLLDESFNPGYGEDIDYCKKAEQIGYKIVQVPDSYSNNFPLWHIGSKTVHSVPLWDDIVARNEKILKDRYNNNIKYSIIIPTYNHFKDCLEPCVQSIIQHTDLSDKEIIIVANGCTDGTKEYIDALANTTFFKALWVDHPIGYIKAINLGIANASGEYVILLNNDTVIHNSNWISILEEPYNKYQNVGISGPHKSWIPELEQEYMLFFCVMIKKSLFNQIGVLDESFGKGYLEDVDFAMRTKQAGYQLVQVPFDISFSKDKTHREENIDHFPIVHIGSATFSDNMEERDGLIKRNLAILKQKHGIKEMSHSRKIYDCFTFFNELDLLEIRLNELYNIVHRFVLVEARYTHQGNPKPLYFDENKQRFNKFLNKIEHIIIDEFPPVPVDFVRFADPVQNADWWRESYQRSAIKQGLKDCADNDIIILTDADEIPCAKTVEKYKPEMGLCCLKMKLYYFKINYEMADWMKARIFPYSEVKNCNIDDFRSCKDNDYVTTLDNGGWHFSFLGNVEHIKQKISSWAHREYNTSDINNEQNILSSISNVQDVFKRDLPLKIVPIDKSYPQYILDNISYYKKLDLVFDVENKYIVPNDKRTEEHIRLYNKNLYTEVLDINSYDVTSKEIEGKYVVDLGANVGAFALLAWRMGAKQIFCFEPNKDNFNLLKNNFVEYSNIKSFNCAVAAPGVNSVKIDGEGVCAKVSDHGTDVPAISLHNIAQMIDDEFVLKIDIEESEYDVLMKTDVKDLLKCSIIYAEFHTSTQHDRTELVSFLTNIGFDVKEIHKVTFGIWTYNGDFIADQNPVNGIYKCVRKPQKPKVYDCFTFCDELDLLEIRLNELDPYVDKFIIAEMTVTHTNFPKPLYFEENKQRFSKFLHKIEHLVINSCPQNPDPWYRERYQRNYMIHALHKQCNDNDIVIISDVDEIPKGNKICEYDSSKDYMYFEQKKYDFYYNLYMGIDPAQPGVFSKISTYGYIRKHKLDLNDLRYKNITDQHKIADGGWHFSWMGGAAKVINKLRSFGHQELLDELILEGKIPLSAKQSDFVPSPEHISFVEKNLTNCIDIFNRKQYKDIKLVNIDNTFPKYIQEHENDYITKGLIKKVPMANVAIVMPYYNDPDLVQKSVNAILNQNYQNWNLFVIDDGSKAEYKASVVLNKIINDRIHIIECDHKGVSAARNKALEIIKSNPHYEYVAYCDSDDIWNKDYLSSQLIALKEADFVYSNVQPVFIENGQNAIPVGIPSYDEYPGIDALLSNGFIYISSVVHHRKCLSVGNFNSKVNSIEDWEMWIRMAKAGFKFKKNNLTSIIYGVKNNGMASKRNLAVDKEMQKLHKDFITRYDTKVAKKDIEVTAYISTKNRYFTTLPLAILSIVNQTVKPKYLVIFDDNDINSRVDLREVAPYKELFQLVSNKGIQWYVFFGEGKGQVHNHQKIINWNDATEWLFRVDDDDVLEPDCLEKLINNINDDVGAIGGSVIMPSAKTFPSENCSGKIEDIYTHANVQWSNYPQPIEVDHLHNTFLYRKSASKHGYCTELSAVAHREETLFSYEMKRNGWKLIVDTSAKTWHLRDTDGGIRSYNNQQLWDHDEQIFINKMSRWGVNFDKSKLIVLDCGLGDHYAFKNILPELKAKYNDIILAVCYPEVFEGDGVKLISIADAMELDKNLDKYNVYKWMWDKNWSGSLVDAYRGMYL